MKCLRATLIIVVALPLLLAGLSCGGGSPPDTMPPSITNVSASNITETSAVIIWTTDEPATSQVEYGTATSYGALSTLDSNLVSSHSVSLIGLQSNTAYHFRARSKDALDNEAFSADFTFQTNKRCEATVVGDRDWLDIYNNYDVEVLIQNTGECSIDLCVGIKVYDSNNNCMTPQNDWFETYQDVDVGEVLKVTGPFCTAPNGHSHKVWLEWVKSSQIPEPITTSDVIVDRIYHRSDGTPHIIFKNMTNRTVSVHYEFKLYNQDNTVENAWERWVTISPSEGVDVEVSWLCCCQSLINKVYILGVS
jgi:hypothetical protein